MGVHQFQNASGVLIDAKFEVRNGILILRSRGGGKGTSTARNTQYGMALRLLLERISQSTLSLRGVWVDSSRVQHVALRKRRILSPEENDIAPKELFTVLSRRMVEIGRDPDSISSSNPNKKLRFEFFGDISEEQIIRIVGLGDFGKNLSGRGRLSVASLKRVSDDYIWRAIQQLRAGGMNYAFGESNIYDVVDDDGNRWPPKSVFGIAATEALGFEVKPEHFESSPKRISHRAIKHAGFRVVGKNETVLTEKLSPSDDDRTWFEGQKKSRLHVKRERSTGISNAKKAEFRRTNGRLYCERCKLDPVETYGNQFGEACIEVHHIVPLAKLSSGDHITLDDLMCLCANCHRIVHNELRNIV